MKPLFTRGIVSRHNFRIWADKQPNQISEWKKDTPKVNVWMGKIKKDIGIFYMFGAKNCREHIS